ncbi:MAG: ATP-binding protein [Proteobacteria bacterium]|nr:ATP-binding protein [Pseudomonadota bacterium]
MKLVQLRLRNFRCFNNEISINFDDITAIIGRNDAGKSSIMDGLNIFFNDGPINKNDAAKNGDHEDVAIIGVFNELPDEVIIDTSETTSLQNEYLLNENNQLEIHKIFNCTSEKPKLSLKIIATHPMAENVKDLIMLGNSDLKKRAKEIGAEVSKIDKKNNVQLRSVIREKVNKLDMQKRSVLLMEGNGKKVWNGIQKELPLFALFKSDRTSTDQDAEAQDPLNIAIKEAVKKKESQLQEITQYIQDEVKLIADLTLKKLQEMDSSLATTLTPEFPVPKWEKLFKANITGDNEIPINKRGSGVRRLILLNFFRAKAELIMNKNGVQNVIYGVEEPETSQHPHNQRLLIRSLQELSIKEQVIFTTHTPMLARSIVDESLRFININDVGDREIVNGGSDETNQQIVKNLGVLPDHNVKLFIGVEGKYDIAFLKNISRILVDEGEDIPDLEKLELDGEIIFIPLGGANLAQWTNRLEGLNRPEFHLFDRDNPPPSLPIHHDEIDKINTRHECKAVSTNKREMENYIHNLAIEQALNDVGVKIKIDKFGDFDDVPQLLLSKVDPQLPQSSKWGKERNCKIFLNNKAVKKMSKTMLIEVDPNKEVLGWFEIIKSMLRNQN